MLARGANGATAAMAVVAPSTTDVEMTAPSPFMFEYIDEFLCYQQAESSPSGRGATNLEEDREAWVNNESTVPKE